MFVRTLVTAAVALTVPAQAAGMFGCGLGDSGSEPPGTRKVPIAVSGIGLGRAGQIPASLRCRRSATWLPIKWDKVPAKTAELVLYVRRVTNRKTSRGYWLSSLVGASLMFGIDPATHRLTPRSESKQASIRYFRPANLCPQRRRGQEFVVTLYALPASLRVSKSALSTEAGAQLDIEAVESIFRSAIGRGTFVARYAR
jgi:hypothetical protein